MKTPIDPGAPFAGAGFHIKDDAAKLVAETVTSLYAELKRPVKAEDLLEASRDPSSPTHRLFQWDDAAAANAYRIEQARYFIRSVKVQHEDGSDTRAILHVAVNEDSGYAPQGAVFADVDLAAAVVAKALQDLRLFANRYQALKGRAELRDVFVAITNAVEAHKNVGRAA